LGVAFLLAGRTEAFAGRGADLDLSLGFEGVSEDGFTKLWWKVEKRTAGCHAGLVWLNKRFV
jgi:hypothetical protein